MASGLDVVQAHDDRRTQGGKLGGLLCLSRLNEAQALTQHLTGDLVVAACDHLLDEFCLAVHQHDIARGHYHLDEPGPWRLPDHFSMKACSIT